MNPSADISNWLNEMRSDRRYFAQSKLPNAIEWTLVGNGCSKLRWKSDGEPASFFAFGMMSLEKHLLTPNGNASVTYTKDSDYLATNTKFRCAVQISGRPHDRNMDSEFELQWGNAIAIQDLIAPAGSGKNWISGRGAMRQMIFSSKLYADKEDDDEETSEDASPYSEWYDMATWRNLLMEHLRPLHDELMTSKCIVPLAVWRPTLADHERCPPREVQAATRAVPVRIEFDLSYYHIRGDHSFTANMFEILILRNPLEAPVSPRKRGLTQSPGRPSPWAPMPLQGKPRPTPRYAQPSTTADGSFTEAGPSGTPRAMSPPSSPTTDTPRVQRQTGPVANGSPKKPATKTKKATKTGKDKEKEKEKDDEDREVEEEQ